VLCLYPAIELSIIEHFLKNLFQLTTDIAEDQPKADLLRAQPEPSAFARVGGVTPLARKILGLENAVDAISDAEKPVHFRTCHLTRRRAPHKLCRTSSECIRKRTNDNRMSSVTK
jgi:hypothetical protein